MLDALGAAPGAFVGIAVVLLLVVKAPLVAAGSQFATFMGAAVFGIALTLVVFAGADLFTGNNMYMIQGVYTGAVRGGALARVWIASLIGNLVGSVAFAALVHGAGTFAAGPTHGKPAFGNELIGTLISAKNATAGGQLFWRPQSDVDGTGEHRGRQPHRNRVCVHVRSTASNGATRVPLESSGYSGSRAPGLTDGETKEPGIAGFFVNNRPTLRERP